MEFTRFQELHRTISGKLLKAASGKLLKAASGKLLKAASGKLLKAASGKLLKAALLACITLTLVTLLTGLSLFTLLSTFLSLVSLWLISRLLLKNKRSRTAEHDYQTCLPTHNGIQKKLSDLIQDALTDQKFAILCLGFDDFRALRTDLSLNDLEQIRIKTAERLRDILDKKHYLGQLSEDRFIIITDQLDGPLNAAELAKNLITGAIQPIEVNHQRVSMNVTGGITFFPQDSRRVNELLRQADFAMMQAQSRGESPYQFYIASIDKEIRQNKQLELDLRDALEHRELSLLFQPQINYQNNSVTGVEVLLRWQHPEKGLIPPTQFIPMAEHSMDIIPIGDWVLESACKQLRDWRMSGHDNLQISVNLSAIQLKDNNIANRTQHLLQKYNIPPQFLELEITESSLIESSLLAAEQLQQIKSIGVKLSLDDFGTGYSTLNYLKQFRFDKIKIDKSFIEGLPVNKENAVIVDAIIQLGRSFGLSTVAEGVESREQEQHLIKSGCEEAQGFLYGKPMSATELSTYLKTRIQSI